MHGGWATRFSDTWYRRLGVNQLSGTTALRAVPLATRARSAARDPGSTPFMVRNEIIAPEEYVDLKTSYGPMRTYVFSPAAAGRYPGLVLFSEIFQVTGPIRRIAAFLAGHGYTVAVPEIFHELEDDPGVVLAYDTAGADRGNSHKITKELASYDADARAVLDFLADHPSCTGKLGSIDLYRRPSLLPCPLSIPMSGQLPASTPQISTSAASARVRMTTRWTGSERWAASC